jgi:hypothetical protein
MKEKKRIGTKKRASRQLGLCPSRIEAPRRPIPHKVERIKKEIPIECP